MDDQSAPGGCRDPMAAALQAIHHGIEEAQSVPLGGVAVEHLVAAAAELHSIRARLESLSGQVVHAIEASQTGPLPGRARSGAALVAAEAQVDPRAVSAEARLADWLVDFPDFAEAHRGGRLTTAHVRLLRKLDTGRTRLALIDAQAYLIEAAGRCPWSEFLRVTRYWLLAADPDGPEPAEQVAARSCRVTKLGDGTVAGRFRLDPMNGQAVMTVLSAAEQRLFRADAESGSGRSAAQRRADALVDALTGEHHAGSMRPSGARPLVHLVLSERVAERLLVGQTPHLDADDPDGRCELVDGTPVDPRHAAGVAAVATLRRLVLGPRGEVLDLGRSVRTFPAHLKAALLAAARGRCQIPSCDAPSAWLQADHVRPWSRGGSTSTANGQVLCDPHNKAKGVAADGWEVDDDP